MIKVTIWNEHIQDKTQENVLAVYPDGINAALASIFADKEQYFVRTATLDQPECGLPQELIDDTDVLIWWAHAGHDQVIPEVVERVVHAVHSGMGFIPLHSSHFALPFKQLMGSSCTLLWRDGNRERLWCSAPAHPIAAGLPAHFELADEEMYGEFFDIPTPDEVVFIGWFSGGEVFRSGVTFHRGLGKIFYFQPGHETCPTYHDANIRKVIENAVLWAKPTLRTGKLECGHPEPLEK